MFDSCTVLLALRHMPEPQGSEWAVAMSTQRAVRLFYGGGRAVRRASLKILKSLLSPG